MHRIASTLAILIAATWAVLPGIDGCADAASGGDGGGLVSKVNFANAGGACPAPTGRDSTIDANGATGRDSTIDANGATGGDATNDANSAGGGDSYIDGDAAVGVDGSNKRIYRSGDAMHRPLQAGPSAWLLAQAGASADTSAIPYSSDTGSGSAGGAEDASGDGSASARPAPMLYGRIDELVNQPGAELPVKLQALTPKIDTSRPGDEPGRGHGSFPEDWLGQWIGELTIKMFDYNPLCARFDPAEFAQTKELMSPDRIGQVQFQFTKGQHRMIDLQPAQVNFAQNVQPHFRLIGNRYGSGFAGSPSVGGGWVRIGLVRPVSTPPFRYILHLGLIQPGIGVTGNSLSGRLLQDTVKKLAPHVLEQEVITYESDVSRLSGSVAHAYSENVIRFTARDANTLAVEAASVRYGPTGDFVDKVILQGTVHRAGSRTAFSAAGISRIPG